MALALDTTAIKIGTGNATWSHTCTGSNLVLLVGLSIWLNGGTAGGASGVTYGSQAMTKIGTTQAIGAFATEWWILVNPATGTHTITPTGISSTTTKAASYSFTGADQTTGYDVVGGTTGTSGTVTQALTLGATNEYMVDIVSHLSANNPSAYSNTIVLNDATSGVSGASQYGSKSGSGSQSISYTYPDPGDSWAYSVVAIKAGSSTIITTKTQSAIARITALTQKTLSAISRITAVTIKTQLGISRINAITSKTITALAHINSSTIVSTKIVSAVARITQFTLKTISAITRISLTGSTIVNESMESSPSTGTLKGSPTPVWLADTQNNSGYLRLTQNLGGQNGELEYNQLLPNAFTCEFEFYMDHSGADAVYFYWGNATTPTSEDDSRGGYTISIDEYSNLFELKFNGTNLSQPLGASSYADGNWHKAKIIVNGTTISLSVDGVQKINYTDTSRTLGGNLFGWASRTGGVEDEHRVRKLLVYYSEGVVLGKSRIVGITIKTISGIAHIIASNVITTKIISGIARITASTTKTITSITRITAVTIKTQSAISRIQEHVNKTISGLARITVSTLKTINSIARITQTSTKAQTGIAHIGLVTIKTIASISRIQEQVNRTITSLARVTSVTVKNILSVSRIIAVTIHTTTAISRINAIVSKTINAISRITEMTQKTINGIARITVIPIKSQTALSRITAVTIKIISGISRLSIQQLRTIAGISNIYAPTTRTIFAKASIKNTTTQTITGTAHINSAYGLYRKVSNEYIWAGKLLDRLGSLYYND